MKREVLSIRVRPSLKKEFLDHINKSGQSACQILEALLTGYLQASKEPPQPHVYDRNTIKPIVIHNHFKRVVKRGRRFFRDTEPERNHYLNPPGIWIYKEGGGNIEKIMQEVTVQKKRRGWWKY